jgi:hypothetical protein
MNFAARRRRSGATTAHRTPVTALDGEISDEENGETGDDETDAWQNFPVMRKISREERRRPYPQLKRKCLGRRLQERMGRRVLRHHGRRASACRTPTVLPTGT